MVTDEVELSAHYVPAWSFAASAQRWKDASTGVEPTVYQDEAPHLALLYSTMALEALIAQELSQAAARLPVDHLMGHNVSILRRWREGTTLLAEAVPERTAAADAVVLECLDRGQFGLLVRARNKLVHPRIHTEVFNEAGHAIDDGSTAQLVADLQAPHVGLPECRPAFPNIIKCRASAEWSHRVLCRMVRLLHEVVARPVPAQWEDVLL